MRRFPVSVRRLYNNMRRLYWDITRKISTKNYFFFARRFYTISKLKCSNVRPLLSITFPQGFRISKNIGHPTLGSGGKKTVIRYLKSEQTDRQTDGQTDGQTDISTYRKHRPRGPMLWKYSHTKTKHTLRWGFRPLIKNVEGVWRRTTRTTRWDI